MFIKLFTTYFTATACCTRWKRWTHPTARFVQTRNRPPSTFLSPAPSRFLSGRTLFNGTIRFARKTRPYKKWSHVRCTTGFFKSLLTLNHLILIGKYFLYKCALNESRYQFADFIALVREKLDLERYIAVLSNKPGSFIKKWSTFI